MKFFCVNLQANTIFIQYIRYIYLIFSVQIKVSRFLVNEEKNYDDLKGTYRKYRFLLSNGRSNF